MYVCIEVVFFMYIYMYVYIYIIYIYIYIYDIYRCIYALHILYISNI